jgi:methyltransferase (TIGR00027 family)
MADPDDAIRDVSDTALWVALYRAQESERKDALFNDPFARRLAGERGRRIMDTVPGARGISWPMVVRTQVFDEIILRLVRERGVDTVVNLAAGLDARPWRLPLPPETHWVDVDLPGMLEHKRQGMVSETPRCRYTTRAADLREPGALRAVLDEVTGGAKTVLALTEGLIIYLDPTEVASLARELASAPHVRYWLTDLASPCFSSTWRSAGRGRARSRTRRSSSLLPRARSSSRPMVGASWNTARRCSRASA